MLAAELGIAGGRAEAGGLAFCYLLQVGLATVLAVADQRQPVLVDPGMVVMGHQLEVGWTVVEAIAVAVVDVLARAQRAAQAKLHNQAVDVVRAALEKHPGIAELSDSPETVSSAAQARLGGCWSRS
jgi:hypothetical protein